MSLINMEYSLLKEVKNDEEMRKILNLFLSIMNYTINFIRKDDNIPYILLGIESEQDNTIDDDNFTKNPNDLDFSEFQKYILQKDFNIGKWEDFADYLIKALGNIIDKDNINKQLLIRFLTHALKNNYIQLNNPLNQIKFTEEGKEFLIRFHRF